MRTKISDYFYTERYGDNIIIIAKENDGGSINSCEVYLTPEECATLVTFIEECYRVNPPIKNKQ